MCGTSCAGQENKGAWVLSSHSLTLCQCKKKRKKKTGWEVTHCVPACAFYVPHWASPSGQKICIHAHVNRQISLLEWTHKYNMTHQGVLASKRSHWALQLCRNKKNSTRAFKCLYLWLLRCFVNSKNLEVGYVCGELPPASASRRQVQIQKVRILCLPQ